MCIHIAVFLKFWIVNLGQPYAIKQIVIVNRQVLSGTTGQGTADRLRDFSIKLLNSAEAEVASKYVDHVVKDEESFTFEGVRSVQYVAIEMADGCLHIAEVRVYENPVQGQAIESANANVSAAMPYPAQNHTR